MTIVSRDDKPNRKIEIDLNGPKGNAFVLLGYAKRFSKELGLDYKEIETKMTSGNYDVLVTVFDNYFGEFVILYK